MDVDDYNQWLGEYTFEPVVNSDYEVSEDVKLPTLKVTVENENHGDTGYVGRPDGYGAPKVDRTESNDMLYAGSIPASYNGYESGNLPEIRNQGSEGACWTFSTMAAIEAEMINNGSAGKSVDLSELQLAYFTTHDYDDPKNCHDNDSYYIPYNYDYLDNGGNDSIAYNALMNSVGPVNEADVPYSKGSNYKVPEKYAVSSNVARINDVYEMNISDADLVKSSIMQHGAVSASFYADELYYNATYNSYYGTTKSVNHAVALVGWDDNFPAENFSTEPGGNGAWLVRNSWGLNDYGFDGYFWLSYYDAGLLYSETVTAYSASTDVYDNVYSYATSDYRAWYTYSTNQVSYTTKYSVAAGETIEAVSVDTINTNSTITVTVKAGNTSSSGSYKNTVAGVYTVPLKKPISLSKDTNVSVTVKISAPGSQKASVVVEDNYYSNGKLSHYTYNNAGTNISGYHVAEDAKIRLYTNNGGSVAVNDSVKLSENEIFLHKGESYQIKLDASSSVSNAQQLTWSSSDTTVATVSNTGLVKAAGAHGAAVITGKYKNQEVTLHVNIAPYNITYVLGDDVKYSTLYDTYYPGNSTYCKLPNDEQVAKDGYTLEGWYSNANLTTNVTSSTLNTSNKDLTLYPKWKTYPVSIVYAVPNNTLTGYTSSTITITTGITISKGNYTIPSTNSMSANPSTYPSQYGVKAEFLYWSLDENGDTPVTQLTTEQLFTREKSKSYGTYPIKDTVVLYPQYGELYSKEDKAEFASTPTTGLWIAGLSDSYKYTGSAYNLVPDTGFRVYDGTKLLTNKKDYTYTLKGNKNVGTMTLTIKGKGNYSGTLVKKMSITPIDLTDNGTGLASGGVYYIQGKSLVKPTLTVFPGIVDKETTAAKLTAGRDYTVAYYDIDKENTTSYDDVTLLKLTNKVGPKCMVVTGKGNYTGSFKVPYITTNKEAYYGKAKLTASNFKAGNFKKNVTYTGKTIEQDYSTNVKCGEQELEYGLNFIVVRGNRTEVGKTNDVIYGCGLYSGVVNMSYSITPKATLTANNTTVEVTKITTENKTVPFTNKAYVSDDLGVKVVLSQTVDGTTTTKNLTEGQDYTVVMPKDSSNVGAKTITIQGINGYAGKITKKNAFTVAKVQASTSNVKMTFDGLDSKSQIAYTKGGVKLTPKFAYNGNTMSAAEANANFKITWSKTNNTAEIINDGKSVVTVTATPKKNFTGTAITASYTIVQADISNAKITAADKMLSSKANAYKVAPVLYDTNGKKLVAGIDYDKTNIAYIYENETDVTYKQGWYTDEATRAAGTEVQSTDIIPAGTVIRVTVVGKGAYKNNTVASATYRIMKKDLSKSTVTLSNNIKAGVTYSGKAKSIKASNITVKFGKTKLVAGTDYYIDVDSYTANTNKGTASVLIKGTGEYGGTKKITFKINPKSMQ